MLILLNEYFCWSRPDMAALAEVFEATCSYFDPLSFMFSPQPVKHIAFYVKMFVFGTYFHEKVILHLEASLN